MITLNRDRGFEQVESWQQVLELPGFTAELNPDKKRLKEIIGRYVFKEKIACGLSTCRQPHARGYIVTTDTGEITNIGNVCGKKHFGVQFEEYSKVFTQAITDYQNRQAIASFLFRLEAIVSEVSALRSENRGADWVYRNSRAFFGRNRGCPDVIVAAVGQMIRSRSGEIRVSRIASESEAKQQEAIAGRNLPRPQYIEEVKGIWRGLPALYHEHDIRELLILDIEPRLQKLGELDVGSATSRELTDWSKWCHEFEGKIERVREAVKSGRLLLAPDNLSQLYVLIDDPTQLVAYQRWISGIASS